MKSAILRDFNNVQVEDLCYPSLELEAGQVLVKIIAATICGAQINEITGAKGKDPYLPHLLGHEGCGVVMYCGPGVFTVSVGQTVVLHWRKGTGIDARPPVYFKETEPDGEYRTYEKIGAGPVATFTEYAVVSENRITPIDDDIDPMVASLFGCAVTTALGIINKEAQLKIGQSIAVAGVGGVGLNIVQGADLVTASRIVAIDKDEFKLLMARNFGATETQLLVGGNAVPVGKPVDVFVDCTGSPAIIDSAIDLVRPGGRLILVGQPRSNQAVFFKNSASLYKNKMIIDSQGGSTDPSVDIPLYISLYKKGKLKLNELITHHFSLERINEAIAVMKTGRCGRVALEMK